MTMVLLNAVDYLSGQSSVSSALFGIAFAIAGAAMIQMSRQAKASQPGRPREQSVR